MISVKNLSKSYETPGETIQVLGELNLSLDAGDTASIVGPSGRAIKKPAPPWIPAM